MFASQKYLLLNISSQSLGSWIFGSITLLFLMGCFIFKRRKIHIWQERLLAFICAISSGLFAFFFTGRIFLAIEYELPQKATLTIQATGGLAIFVLVLFWWFKAGASPTSKIPSIPPNPTDEKLISALVSQSEVKGQLQFEINGLKR